MGRGEQAAAPQPASGQKTSYAALNANGTGPFVITEHQPGVKTIFKKNPNWWGKAEHNIDEVDLHADRSDATRVAALLSGEIDLIDPVPLQDVAAHQRERQSPQVLPGPELRTIFLGFDQMPRRAAVLRT